MSHTMPLVEQPISGARSMTTADMPVSLRESKFQANQ